MENSLEEPQEQKEKIAAQNARQLKAKEFEEAPGYNPQAISMLENKNDHDASWTFNNTEYVLPAGKATPMQNYIAVLFLKHVEGIDIQKEEPKAAKPEKKAPSKRKVKNNS